MRDLKNCKVEFKWIGPKNSNDGKKKNCHYYNSFCFGDLKVEIGDYVLVRNDDSLDPEDWRDCFVAQVKTLIHSESKRKPNQAEVQWFSRVSELPQYSLKLLSNMDHQYEVIEELRSNWSRRIDAETIFKKCLVFFLSVDDDYQSLIFKYKGNQHPVFFCRYFFNGTNFFPKLENSSSSYTSGVSSFTPKVKGMTCSDGKKTRNSVLPKTNKSLNGKSMYSAISMGGPGCPKVLIKKLDDKVLKYCDGNARIFVKSHETLPIDQLSNILTKSLNLKTELKNDNLDENIEKNVFKRPIIHSFHSNQTGIDNEMRCKSEENIPQDCILKFSPKVSKRSAYKLKQNKNSVDNVNDKELALKEEVYNDNEISKQIMNDKNHMSTPSPAKKLKIMKERSSISGTSDFTLTRSGRKVKILNYCETERSEVVRKSVLPSNLTKKEKAFNFVRDECTDSDSSFSSKEIDSDEASTSDCSLLDEKCVPLSNKKTPKMRSSVKRNIFALNIPNRKTPLKIPQNILEESRQKLHVSSVPKSLPCREDEYSDIYSFIKACLCAYTGGCMYISGVPGTGKTATVHEVMKNLESEQEMGDIPNFNFVEINGMWMTDPYQCYVHIYKSLTGKTIASQQAAALLEKRFTEPGAKKDAVVMLVDELDRLWTRKQTVMYNIFDWPTKKHSKLIVLAIANTMDLPERLMMNRISSRLGLTRKTFQPYTYRQLQEIIMSRVQELKVFDPDAVQLVARKVAAVSGDARRALDICRFAAEVVQMGKSSPKKRQKVLVGMEHVDIALQQMFSSPLVSAIRASSNTAKLFFKSIISEFTRTGTEETVLSKVYNHIVSNCRFEGLHPPSFAEISNICSHLAASHLILVDNFHNDLYMKIRLNVSPDDVNYALTGR